MTPLHSNQVASLHTERTSARTTQGRTSEWLDGARRMLAERIRGPRERSGMLRAFSWLVPGGRQAAFYDQDVFRHFLAIEYDRVRRADRSLFLLLVTTKASSRIRRRLAPLVAARIFSSLWHSVREVDVIGWYQRGQAAGAVLIHGGQPVPQGSAARIQTRVVETLRERLPKRAGEQVRVRVIEIGPGTRLRSR